MACGRATQPRACARSHVQMGVSPQQATQPARAPVRVCVEEHYSLHQATDPARAPVRASACQQATQPARAPVRARVRRQDEYREWIRSDLEGGSDASASPAVWRLDDINDTVYAETGASAGESAGEDMSDGAYLAFIEKLREEYASSHRASE